MLIGFADTIQIGLPQIQRILNVTNHGASAWASAFRIDAHLHDGQDQSFFLKVINRQ